MDNTYKGKSDENYRRGALDIVREIIINRIRWQVITVDGGKRDVKKVLNEDPGG